MNFEELKSRDVKSLRELAAQYGIRTHHKNTAETVAKLIFEFVANQPKVEAMKHPAEMPVKAPPKMNTEAEVREAIAKQLEKPGFVAEFLPDDTWYFKYKGAEESGHMTVPLRWIKIKAEGVARGAVNPRGLYDNKLNSTPNSGIVLMV